MKMELRLGLSITPFISCLKKTEHWINENGWKLDFIIKYANKKKRVELYRGLVDFVLCECLPDPHKRECMSYYQGRGERLVVLYPEKVIKDIDKCLVNHLIVLSLRALNMDCTKRWALS